MTIPIKKRDEKGLRIRKYFSEPGKFPEIEYKKSDEQIADESGNFLFVQKGCEFPSFYSPLARKIIASRYFYGEKETSEREYSMKQMVERVTESFLEWAQKQNYLSKENAKIFKEELNTLTLSQMISFNSPVWFNVGTDKYESKIKGGQHIAYTIKKNIAVEIPANESYSYPQTAACFIQSVDDTMEGIMDLAKKEAMLFKDGSGTGTDLSTLRSSREKLSGGGKPSGPMAYEMFYDRVAGIVKSGGKTRRAAKMNSLRIDHPDIFEFIEAKAKEQKKIQMLVNQGLSEKEAIETAAYQNANFSVRVTDSFMNAVEKDLEWKTVPVHSKDMADKMPKYKARELFRKIAEGTWVCGDPGLQYHGTINKWHTCPNSGLINASNPCSEYMFLNDSACNLASLNLRAFQNLDGTFNIKDFCEAVNLTAIAQDLEIDNSAYPTKKIAENAHKFRPLGMGYANLGSLIMSLGLPYDSDEARNIAASITALLTGKVYETSAEMARVLGTFEEFEKNKNPMLEVMKMHREKLKNIEKNKLPKGLEDILDEAEKTWDNVIIKGKKYGFRNAQAALLAPTGTIGFAMDCDTKGIEPEIGLIQYKKLAEGGILKLVNGTVGFALQRLGYNEKEIELIKKHIEENETIEGSLVKDEHLAIFDCSNKPKNGKRTISSAGHLKMMAAVQPFLSGAISKTVNLPEEATVEDIEKVYMDAWKMGLKAVALYRDGSKVLQPLSFSKNNKNLEEKISPDPAVRVRLPNTRNSKTHKFKIGGHDGYVTVGLYNDGKAGEVFITMAKEGSTLSGVMDGFGTAISISLQHGVPLETFVNKFTGTDFEPRGWVEEGDKENIKQAKSILDYIFRWLGYQFIPNYGKMQKENGNEINKVLESTKSGTDLNEIQAFKKPKGPLQEGICLNCGNSGTLYKIKDCMIYCDPDFGGCNFLYPKGCFD